MFTIILHLYRRTTRPRTLPPGRKFTTTKTCYKYEISCLNVHNNLTRVQADNAPTCGVAEWVHSLAAQLSQAPQLAAYHQILSTDHELR